jgi:ankyrin repeat protein
MRRRYLFFRSCLLLLLIWPCLEQAAAQELITKSVFEKQFEITSRMIVMLNVEYPGGVSEIGAGFIFGHDTAHLYIATADHVVHRGAQPLNIQVRLRTLDKPIKATLLKSIRSADLDLAVLSIGNLSGQGIHACAFPYDRLRVEDDLKRGDTVYPIGNPGGESWAEPVEPERVSKISDKEIVFQSASITGGNSGGPLIDGTAALVGMTTADQPPFGRATNMGLLLSQIKEWGYPVQLSNYTEPGLGPPDLHIAAMNGDIVTLKKLLAGCHYPDEVDDHYVTALQLAAYWGKPEIMTLLVKAGADIGAQDAVGDAPLHHAVDRPGNLESIKWLIKGGAKVNLADYQGLTPLLKVLSADSIDNETALFLIHSGADVNLKDLEKNTPLHYAVENGNAVIAKALVGAGAKLESEGKYKRTPLLLAVESKQTEMVQLLIAAGAAVNGKGALLLAAGHPSNSGIIKSLLAAGANVNEKDEEGNTPLHKAVYSGHDYHADPVKDQVEAINLLLKAGAEVNAVNGNGNTPLAGARKLYTDPAYGSEKDKEDYLNRFKAIEGLLRSRGAK